MAQAVKPQGNAARPEMSQSPSRFRFELHFSDLFWVLGLILVVIGAAGLVQRLSSGLMLTNLTSYVPWGLWVGFYDYLVWIEVGSLLVFTGMLYLAGEKRLARIKPLVLFTGFTVLVMALLLVLLDLGRAERFWHVIVYPDFGSMITWMVWLHGSYLLVLAVELLLVMWGDGRGERILKFLSLLSLPMGLALILVSGSIFGVVAARPLWNTASLPLMFLVSALAAGSSLLLLLIVLFWRDKGSEAYKALVRRMSTITGILLVTGVFAASVIAFTMLYTSSGSPSRADALNLILTGPYWWSFWILHILLGVIVPLIIHFTVPNKPRLVGIAAALSAVTFVAVTLNIVIPVLVTPELEGLATAFVDPKLNPNYAPNAMEWMVIVFVLGVGGLIYGLGLRFLPLKTQHAEVSHD